MITGKEIESIRKNYKRPQLHVYASDLYNCLNYRRSLDQLPSIEYREVLFEFAQRWARKTAKRLANGLEPNQPFDSAPFITEELKKLGVHVDWADAYVVDYYCPPAEMAEHFFNGCSNTYVCTEAMGIGYCFQNNRSVWVVIITGRNDAPTQKRHGNWENKVPMLLP